MDGRNPKQDPRDSLRGAGVRVPVKGESSSGELRPATGSTSPPNPPPPPTDAEATMVDIDSTLVDSDATLAGVTPPPRSSKASDLFASAAILQIGDVLAGRYKILQLLG